MGFILPPQPDSDIRWKEERTSMTWLSLIMFVSLISFGQHYFGWSDPEGKVQLALFTTFVLGVICGYKTKG
jgi:hypothetical protein